MSRFASLVLVSLALSSCAVEPYCFDCVDDSIDSGRPDAGDSGARDAGDTGAPDAPPRDTNPPDAWVPPDGCSPGATELCNHFDDDCDLMIDEGVSTDTDIDNCGSCGHQCIYAHAFAECTAGTCSMSGCAVGYYDIDGMSSSGCEYHCSDTGAEICDRRDNNCDGQIDEGFDLMNDPNNCGICGRVCNLAHTTASSCTSGMCAIGGCATGFVDRDGVAANGCEYACTLVGAETCNRRDDDCDGMIDEDVAAGGSCGSSTGICMPGTLTCVGGSMTCTGGVSPGVESCNGLDDDCDGTVDDGNPGGGAACGSSTGACLPGRQTCVSGALSCVGATGPQAETCDGIDNDCNGVVDNGDPGGGAACGVGTGACTQGVQHCVGGSISCMGGNGPVLETCNTVDDDCNGVVDDGFDLMNDVRNCGSCGHVCSFPNAVPQCVAGSCRILACAGGYVNLDMSPTGSNGCEYMCTRTSATESCNGIDDNCNGTVDESVTIPANFCRTVGVCAGSTPSCTAGVLSCNYPAGTYQSTETRCDSLDNDCNGVVDDPWPQLNPSNPAYGCNNGGIGACNRTGHWVCNGTSAIMCNAPAGSPTTESCNGIDDNCNGTIDDGTSARGTWTQIRPAGGTGATDFWIQTYEASRPGATSSSQGTFDNMACSVTGVLPWTSVTPVEAQAACAAAGGSLCTEAQWQRACESSAATACTWSEASTCTTYSSTACNGIDYDTSSSTAGNQDSLISTGTLATCRVPSTVGGTTGQVYDMSGNAQEWTMARSAGINPIRGGSYNDIAGGMTCGFSFEVGGNAIRLPNTGFRCCRTSAP